MLAGVGVLGGHRDPAVLAVHVVGGGRAVEAATVGEAAPRGVDLREVGVVAPVAAVDQLQQARAVGAGLGAENPCGGAAFVAVLGEVGPRVGAYVVVVVGFVEARDESHRVVEHRDHMREGVAEEAGDAHGDVDARAAEFGERDRLQVRPPGATRRPTRAGHPAAQALRRCRRRRCASPRCPTPTARPTAASRRSPRGSGRAANPPSPHRFPTPAGTAPPWGRPSRSCGRWAAR